MIESYIRSRLREKDILLMTHIVLGYPTMDTSLRLVEAMVAAGVDIIELQIPFSEPSADGPVILNANQVALRKGVRVRDCLEAAREVSRTFDIPFLIMSYYNILFSQGLDAFAARMAGNGLRGAIVPDLPPEEGGGYLDAMDARGLAPILLFSPTTPFDRMARIAERARGFIYCVARRGVTGARTRFSEDLAPYLDRCRRATPLPLALGFGVKGLEDVSFLRGKVDIAVIGTQVLRLLDRGGVAAVAEFLEGLRG